MDRQIGADPSASGSPARTAEAVDRRASFRLLAQKYGGVLVLLGLILLFGLLTPETFLTSRNWVGILDNQAIGGIVALGLLLPLCAGVFDISVAGFMTLSVVGVMVLFQNTEGRIPVFVAVLVVFAAAVLAGLLNSYFVVRRGVQPFIATIGTSALFIGASQYLSGGATITYDIPKGFLALGRSSIGPVPGNIVIFAVLALAVHYVLTYTPFGRGAYATGFGPVAARLAGVPTRRIITIAYISSAVGAAVAGMLFAARLGTAPPDVGNGYLLSSYAIAFLGATIIKPGRFNVMGLIVAMLIVAVGINGLQLLGTPFWVIQVFQGGVLLLAVLLSSSRER